jgi:hypothetical protein
VRPTNTVSTVALKATGSFLTQQIQNGLYEAQWTAAATVYVQYHSLMDYDEKETIKGKKSVSIDRRLCM